MSRHRTDGDLARLERAAGITGHGAPSLLDLHRERLAAKLREMSINLRAPIDGDDRRPGLAHDVRRPQSA